MWDLWWAEWHWERISSEDFSLLQQIIIPAVIHVHFSLGAVTIGHTSCSSLLHVIIRYILLTFTLLSDLLDRPTLAIVYRMGVFIFSFYVFCNASFCVGELNVVLLKLKLMLKY
jgi:hypothetical protein